MSVYPSTCGDHHMLSVENIRTQLSDFKFPVIEMTLPLKHWLKKLEVEGERVHIQVKLGFPSFTVQQQMIQALKDYLKGLWAIEHLEIDLSSDIQARVIPTGLAAIPGVKNIIAIASGKGGVGKSTVAANLACALSQEGAQVGLLDADIYGPNQPQMMGLTGKPHVSENNQLEPLRAHGLQVMSMGFLIENQETPMVWRGPMISMALQQLLNDSHWENLDYLIIDLPPGTGDVQLTLAQKIPVTGAVIVTTPQEIALLDVRKAVKMFEKVRVPILGVIENMSVYHCPSCGHEEHLFGTGGGQNIQTGLGVEYLGELPLLMAIREYADTGIPMVVAEPNSELSWKYRQLALKVAAKLSLSALDHSGKFPEIVVEKG